MYWVSNPNCTDENSLWLQKQQALRFLTLNLYIFNNIFSSDMGVFNLQVSKDTGCFFRDGWQGVEGLRGTTILLQDKVEWMRVVKMFAQREWERGRKRLLETKEGYTRTHTSSQLTPSEKHVPNTPLRVECARTQPHSISERHVQQARITFLTVELGVLPPRVYAANERSSVWSTSRYPPSLLQSGLEGCRQGQRPPFILTKTLPCFWFTHPLLSPDLAITCRESRD